MQAFPFVRKGCVAPEGNLGVLVDGQCRHFVPHRVVGEPKELPSSV